MRILGIIAALAVWFSITMAGVCIAGLTGVDVGARYPENLENGVVVAVVGALSFWEFTRFFAEETDIPVWQYLIGGFCLFFGLIALVGAL